MKYAPPLDASGPNESYVDANPTAGIQGSIVPAAALEPGMREIVKVIEDAGLTPSDSDNTQLAQAIDIKIAKASPKNNFTHLSAMQATAPTGAYSDGDIYYNTASKMILTRSSGAWDSPANPESGVLYEFSGTFFIWDGSDLKAVIDLSDYAKADFSNVDVPYITETWQSSDGQGWYHKYSDGWIRQGGIVDGPANTSYTLNYYTPFVNSVPPTIIRIHNSSSGTLNASAVRSYTNTSAIINNAGTGSGFLWQAEGK